MGGIEFILELISNLIIKGRTYHLIRFCELNGVVRNILDYDILW